MKKFITSIFVLMIAVLTAEAAVKNVFFAGGQSNAKASWGAAIASGLRAGYGSNLVMVHVNHSGEAMDRWFTTLPRANYSNDFFNASGTGALQAQIQAITDAGDEAVFQGFFWFQGETDTGSTASMDAYTNRFSAMMAQLKTDLALTNDVHFTMAIIDGNPDPVYDDPANTGGRTRADIDYLRARQIGISSSPNGSYVDTRGYERSDLWHVKTSAPDDLSRLGLNMSIAFTNAFGISLPAVEPVDIFSDDADGCIYASGFFAANDQICGITSGNPYNGIALFQLPAYLVESVSLSLTVVTDMGAMTDANIDLWGLGYVSAPPAMDKAWMLLADTDSRLLLNNVVPVKIGDNIVAASQPMAVNTVWQSDAAQQVALKNFINGLYAQGAQPGDFAVIRTNPDALPAATAAGLRWGGSHQISPDRRAKLSVILSDVPAVEPPTTETVTIYSHANDGAVFPTGTFTAQDLLSSTGGGDTGNYTGIAIFELPEQLMTDVNMSMTAVSVFGMLPGINIDLWGLGYTTTPYLNKEWFSVSDTDTRLLLNGLPPVKIADNIVTNGQSVSVGEVWRPTAPQRVDLRRFLNGLYSNGAKPGDYAVIRVNMDADPRNVGCGVRWGGSHRTDPERRAMLTATIPIASNYVANSSFELGTGANADNWSVSYNNFLGQRTNSTPRTGDSSFRVAVNGDQSGNTANNLNFFQDIHDASLSGQRVTLHCFARHNSDEPLVINSLQKVETRLWWLYGSTINGMVDSSSQLLPTDPQGVYKDIKVSGVVPEGADGVRVMVIFRTGTYDDPSITTGAAMIDDLSLTVFKPYVAQGSLMIIR